MELKTMRWQQSTLALILGLGIVTLGGCANLRWTGDSGALSSGVTNEPVASSSDFDPASDAKQASAKTDAAVLTASEQSQNNLLESQFALARLSERRGEDDQAEEIYRALLERAPQDARLHHRLGVLAVKKNDFAQAEEQFRTATSMAPATADLLSDLGYCYYLQQKLPEAEETFNQALKLEPRNAAAVNNLALVMGMEGRYRESLELFKRNNTEAKAYANLAYVLAQKGETAQAGQMYLRALTLDNSMRAAAQAVLQISDREQAHAQLKSASAGAPKVAARVSEPKQEAERAVSAPEAVGQDLHTGGAEATAPQPETPLADVAAEPSSEKEKDASQAANASSDEDKRSS